MLILRTLLIAVVLSLPLTAPAHASDNGSLFVNLTTDDVHRANMALAFSKAQMDLGHPITVWLNDKGVFLGDADSGEKLGEPQAKLRSLIADGAQVIACPMCMKHYGVTESRLIEGIKVGKPDMTGAALFRDGAKTLSW